MPREIIPTLLDETSSTPATSIPTAPSQGNTRQPHVVRQGTHWREGTPTDDGQYFGYLLHTVTYHHITYQQTGAKTLR